MPRRPPRDSLARIPSGRRLLQLGLQRLLVQSHPLGATQVLLQVIGELESRGDGLLSPEVLSELIRRYPRQQEGNGHGENLNRKLLDALSDSNRPQGIVS
ncbi:MAG: hypothetical protein KY410_07960 [Proteobacteria bacterium]|nr:hypothetical protein [Pseudomonadota bacterium]